MWLPALAINNAQSLLNDRFKLMSLTFSVAYLNIYHSKCIYSFIMSLCLNNKNNKHAKKEFICRVFFLIFSYLFTFDYNSWWPFWCPGRTISNLIQKIVWSEWINCNRNKLQWGIMFVHVVTKIKNYLSDHCDCDLNILTCINLFSTRIFFTWIQSFAKFL